MYFRAPGRWGSVRSCRTGTLLPANEFITSVFGCKRRAEAHSWRAPQHAQRGRHALKRQGRKMRSPQARGRPARKKGMLKADRRAFLELRRGLRTRPARPGAALSCAQTAAEEARGGRAKQGFGGMGRVMEPDTHAKAWPGEPPDARRGPWDRFSRRALSLDGRRRPSVQASTRPAQTRRRAAVEPWTVRRPRDASTRSRPAGAVAGCLNRWYGGVRSRRARRGRPA